MVRGCVLAGPFLADCMLGWLACLTDCCSNLVLSTRKGQGRPLFLRVGGWVGERSFLWTLLHVSCPNPSAACVCRRSHIHLEAEPGYDHSRLDVVQDQVLQGSVPNTAKVSLYARSVYRRRQAGRQKRWVPAVLTLRDLGGAAP